MATITHVLHFLSTHDTMQAIAEGILSALLILLIILLIICVHRCYLSSRGPCRMSLNVITVHAFYRRYVKRGLPSCGRARSVFLHDSMFACT
jgi:hypothetical protein